MKRALGPVLVLAFAACAGEGIRTHATSTPRDAGAEDAAARPEEISEPAPDDAEAPDPELEAMFLARPIVRRILVEAETIAQAAPNLLSDRPLRPSDSPSSNANNDSRRPP